MSGMQKGKEFPFLKRRKFSWIVFYGIFLKVLKSCFFFFFPLLEVSAVLKISVLKNCDSTLWKFEYPAFPFHHRCQGFSLGSFLLCCLLCLDSHSTHGKLAAETTGVNHGEYKPPRKTGRMRDQSKEILLHSVCSGVKEVS